jgi:hypothetical protein
VFWYLKVLKGKDRDLRLLLERVLKSADYGGFQAECLTDTWIGKDRFNLFYKAYVKTYTYLSIHAHSCFVADGPLLI